MRGKKGDIELQFNWIFVFIVGTLILAAAAGFVIKQKNNSDSLIAGQMIRFTRTIITLTSATPGIARPEALQKPIGVACEADTCNDLGCTSDIYIYPRSLQAKVDIPITVVFSPELIMGDNMGTWSMDWSMPFHVNNFLYMTSDEARYVFVKMGNQYDSMVEELYEEIPDAMGDKDLVELAELKDIKDRNNYQVRIIFIDDGYGMVGIPGAISKMDNKDVTALKIIPYEGWKLGTVQFFVKSPAGDFQQKGEHFYLGAATVFGAVFSDDEGVYECNLQKALLRYSRVSELYKSKAVSLAADPATSDKCDNLYDQVRDHLDLLIYAIQNIHQNPDYPSIKAESTYIGTLSHSLTVNGCPLVY